MKKNILLILLFISMFFIGSNDVEALKCSFKNDNDKKCTREAIQEELGNMKQLVCTYKIEYEHLESEYDVNKYTTSYYYNYIYYDLNKREFFAGSTHNLGKDGNGNVGKKLHTFNPNMNGLPEDLLSFDNDQMMLISEGAHDLLTKNNQCPKKSYISKNANQVCFDNAEECKNNGKGLDYTTDFNSEKKHEGQLEQFARGGIDGFKYKKLFEQYEGIEKKDIPSGYNDICTYKAHNGNYIHLMYNDTTNRIIYKKTSEKQIKKMIIDNNKSVSFDDAGTSYYESYANNIGQIKSCPNLLYEEYTHTVDDSTRNTTVFHQTKPEIAEDNKKGTTITEYKLYDASDKSGTTLEPIDECSDLIDPNSGLGKIIKTILKVIGIAVPILLIGLVTFDLATAVLAGDDKAVNTAKSNAIKRVIIAVIIFFVPTLMNFVFGLINEVWDRNFSTCIEELNK